MNDNLLKLKRDQISIQPKRYIFVTDKIGAGRVISKLLSNAIKFSTKGGIILTTTGKIRYIDTSGQIYISTEDRDTGLSLAISP